MLERPGVPGRLGRSCWSLWERPTSLGLGVGERQEAELVLWVGGRGAYLGDRVKLIRVSFVAISGV